MFGAVRQSTRVIVTAVGPLGNVAVAIARAGLSEPALIQPGCPKQTTGVQPPDDAPRSSSVVLRGTTPRDVALVEAAVRQCALAVVVTTVGKGASVADAVAVRVFVALAVAVFDGVRVAVGVAVAVLVSVGVAVAVSEELGVAVGVLEGVTVAV